MRISDLLSPADVLIDVRAANKRLLLQDLATKAANSLGLNLDQVAPYLLKREDLGSTGIGRGVAIPHARLPDLQRPYGLLAKLTLENPALAKIEGRTLAPVAEGQTNLIVEVLGQKKSIPVTVKE